MAANRALIDFYWELGKMINEKHTQWGSRFLETLSKDLKQKFPDMGGLSLTNLKYCKLIFTYSAIRPQPGDEIKL